MSIAEDLIRQIEALGDDLYVEHTPPVFSKYVTSKLTYSDTEEDSEDSCVDDIEVLYDYIGVCTICHNANPQHRYKNYEIIDTKGGYSVYGNNVALIKEYHKNKYTIIQDREMSSHEFTNTAIKHFDAVKVKDGNLVVSNKRYMIVTDHQNNGNIRMIPCIYRSMAKSARS